MLTTFVPLLLALPCAPAEIQDPFPLFAEAKDGLIIPAAGEQGSDLLSLATAYSLATGQSVHIGAQTGTLLENTSTGLTTPLEVPKERVQEYFERLLIENDFCVQVLSKESPRLLGIESLNTGSRVTLRNNSIHLDVDQVDAAAKHPAVIFTTVVNLPNTDVRQLSNSMRTMITDANTQQMLPAGNTNSMVLTGFGSSIGEMVQLLKKVDDASRVDPALAKANETVFHVVSLKHANAQEVKTAIDELAGTAAGAGADQQPKKVTHQSMRLYVDARTNSLCISAKQKEIERLEALIQALDKAPK